MAASICLDLQRWADTWSVCRFHSNSVKIPENKCNTQFFYASKAVRFSLILRSHWLEILFTTEVFFNSWPGYFYWLFLPWKLNILTHFPNRTILFCRLRTHIHKQGEYTLQKCSSLLKALFNASTVVISSRELYPTGLRGETAMFACISLL